MIRGSLSRPGTHEHCFVSTSESVFGARRSTSAGRTLLWSAARFAYPEWVNKVGDGRVDERIEFTRDHIQHLV